MSETYDPAKSATAALKSIDRGILAEDSDGELIRTIPSVLPEGMVLRDVGGKVELVPAETE